MVDVRPSLPLVLFALVLACSTAGTAGTAPVTPVADLQSPGVRPAATAEAALPRLTAVQSRATASVVAFLDAYNARELDRALALMTDDVRVFDCDYRAGRQTTAYGKEQAAAWLRRGAADHDTLVLTELYFGTPTSAGFAVAVSYERRTSDTLRSLGFPNGIAPPGATKVVVTNAGDRISAFVNGSANSCRPG